MSSECLQLLAMHPSKKEQDFMLAQYFKDRVEVCSKNVSFTPPHTHFAWIRCEQQWDPCSLLPTAAAQASLPREHDAAPGTGAVPGTHVGPPTRGANIFEKRQHGYQLPSAFSIGG